MKKLKLCILLTFCFLILGVSCKKIYAQESKTISIDGEWIDGNVDEDVCFYTFTIPSSGTVTYTFQSYSESGALCLKDETLATTYSRIQGNGTSSNPSSETTTNVLEQGTYVLKIYQYNFLVEEAEYNWTGNYRLNVTFTPANNTETEPNDTFETAMNLTENNRILGLMSDCENEDYFKLTLNKSQTIHIIYRYDVPLCFSLYDDNFLPIIKGTYYFTGTEHFSETLNKGTYYIKISKNSSSWGGTYTLKWYIDRPITSLTLRKQTLEQGQQYTISPIIEPQNATNKQLTWQSSNTSVATIDASGKIKAKHAGVTTITASTEDGSDLSANCIVTVLPKKATITTLRSLLKETGVTITLRKQTGVSGYQIAYSTSKNFKNKKLITTKRTKVTQKKLARNKKYYFKARAYYTYKNTRYYGAWGDTITIENLF